MQIAEDEFELDISGRIEQDEHVRRRRDASRRNSLVRVADVAKTAASGGSGVAARNATKTTDLPSNRPLVFYVWREQTDRDVKLLQMLPSRRPSTLTREECHLHGHGAHLLVLQQRGDVTDLLFKHQVHRKRQLDLQVVCDAECADCEPFKVSLIVNIL